MVQKWQSDRCHCSDLLVRCGEHSHPNLSFQWPCIALHKSSVLPNYIINLPSYITNSSFVQTADATPPMMYQGLSTDWPPLTLVPASVHKSGMRIKVARMSVKAAHWRSYFWSHYTHGHMYSHSPLKPSITSFVTVALSFRVISLLTPVSHNTKIPNDTTMQILCNSHLQINHFWSFFNGSYAMHELLTPLKGITNSVTLHVTDIPYHSRGSPLPT